MVATRKSSSTQPLPPTASRTNSTTSSPKIKPRKSGSLAGSPAPLPPAPGVAVAGNKDLVRPEFADPPKVIGSSPLKNSVSKSSIPSPPQLSIKSPKKKKAGKVFPGRPTSKATSRSLKLLRNTIIAGFVAHTLLVCPYDDGLESSVCTTVQDFRTYFNHYILEPYLRPGFDQLASHPSISPYAQSVIQYSSSAVSRVQPILYRTGAQANRVYLSQLGQAEKSIRHHSGPYMKQLNQYYDTSVHPFVDKHLLPPYNAYLVPTLNQLDNYGKIAGMRVEPYLHRAVVELQRGGRKVQPYALTALGYAAQVPGLVRQHAWEPLMDARRTYVDPPISKIMETVEEAGGEAKAATTSKFMAHARETAGEQQVFEGAPTSEESYVH